MPVPSWVVTVIVGSVERVYDKVLVTLVGSREKITMAGVFVTM